MSDTPAKVYDLVQTSPRYCPPSKRRAAVAHTTTTKAKAVKHDDPSHPPSGASRLIEALSKSNGGRVFVADVAKNDSNRKRLTRWAHTVKEWEVGQAVHPLTKTGRPTSWVRIKGVANVA